MLFFVCFFVFPNFCEFLFLTPTPFISSPTSVRFIRYNNPFPLSIFVFTSLLTVQFSPVVSRESTPSHGDMSSDMSLRDPTDEEKKPKILEILTVITGAELPDVFL
jgi:hypothetical protein